MIKNILDNFVTQSRSVKRLIVVINDGLISIFSFSLVSFLISGSVIYNTYFVLFQIGIIVFFFFYRIYDNVIKHIGSNYIYRLIIALSFPHIFYILYIQLFLENSLLQIVLLINFFIMFSLLSISRMVAKSFLYQSNYKQENIAIYVDENYNSAIVDSINHLNQYKIIAIINDNKKNKGLYMTGVEVYHISDLRNLIVNKKLKKLFLASQKNIVELKNIILDELSNSPLKIIEIPKIDDVLDGKYSFDSLKNLSIEDVVDRQTYNFVNNEDNKGTIIESKNVLITGAGGSIGSVLCSQILSYQPKSIILLDHSESALFVIEQKLKRMNTKVNIKTKLIDLSDKDLLKDLFLHNKIDMVYHAAAYKHVDMLERNIISAVKNNIIGLYHLLYQCKKYSIEHFVLVSTDKAVKPTTFMGLTKKFCELMLFSLEESKKYQYSAVRFGNVFNSSGSVIPIFKKQIENQNYLTVTDENVTRYFMSIEEAAHLVLKASLISRGGEMFILDMGKPRKILDIAKKMIHLSGNTIKSDENPGGDIEIKIIGLGKSEKMHEELSESKVESTSEDKILKSKDSQLGFDNLEKRIQFLLDGIANNDKDIIKNYLENECFKNHKKV